MVNNSPKYEELLKQVEDWILFDSRIIDDYSDGFKDYQIDLTINDQSNQEMCDKLNFSVIITSLIVPPRCTSFKLPIKVLNQLTKDKYNLDDDTVKKIISKINKSAINIEEVNYKYFKIIFKMSNFEPITISELQEKENLSKILKYMEIYKIKSCLAIDYILPNIAEILLRIQHLPKEKQNIIISQVLSEPFPSNEGPKNKLRFFKKNFIQNNEKIAYYITKNQMKRKELEEKQIEMIKLDNTLYHIIQIENLYINYLYLENIEKIEKSIIADKIKKIDYTDILKLESPNKFLKKDMIIFLSQINENDFNEKEKIIIQKSFSKLFSTNESLDISNNDLHLLYCRDERAELIQFQDRTQKSFQNEDIDNINIMIHELSFMIHSTLSKIRAIFIYLLNNSQRNEQLNENHNNSKLMQSVFNLAKKLLTPFDNQPIEQYIVILSEGDKFAEIRKTNDPPIIINNAYITESCDINEKYEDYKKMNFIDLEKKYNNYLEYLGYIQQIQAYVKDFKKYQDITGLLSSISLDDQLNYLSTKLSKEIFDFYKKFSQLYENNININSNIPLFTYNELIDPFENTYDALMIFNKKGKITFLHQIDFDLGDCLKDSTLILNIINRTNANIQTDPMTKINQKENLLMINTKLTKEDQEIKLFKGNDSNYFGSIHLKSHFVEPEIYLIFTTPVIINDDTIYVENEIYEQFSIYIYSNISKISHVLKLKTVNGSKLTKNFVKIENKNKFIKFTFLDNNKFKADMEIAFPKINISIYIRINIDAKTIKKTSVFDAVKLNELTTKDKMAGCTYYVLKSPLKPPFLNLTYTNDNKNAKLIAQNIPYLHLIYSNSSFFTTKLCSQIRRKYFDISINANIKPKLHEFKMLRYNNDMYFEYSQQRVCLIESRNMDLVVEFTSNENGKINGMKFLPSSGNHKNYSKNGIMISNNAPDFLRGQIDQLIEQINISQSIKFDKSMNIIPWLNILILFETSIDTFIAKNKDNIIKKLSLNSQKETYYVMAKSNGLLEKIDNIPDSITNKKVTQTIKESNDISYDFGELENINYRNVFDIIDKLDEIKFAFMLYRKIFKENRKLAIILSNIYQILKWFMESNIMKDTFEDVFSIADSIFTGNCNKKLRNIEIIYDDYKKKSSLDVKFKYPEISKDYSNNEIKSNDLSKNTENKLEKSQNDEIHVNNLYIPNHNNNDIRNNNRVNGIYKILSKKEEDQIMQTIDDNNNENEDSKPNNKTIKTIVQGAIMNYSKNNFDETKLPQETLNCLKKYLMNHYMIFQI